MTKTKMIVIWGDEDILSSSIELILTARAEWKVVYISNKEDLGALIMAEGAVQPDIVIIHQECRDNPANFPLQFLQDHPTIKVISVNLENNLLDVYSKQKILVKKTSDLIEVIDNAL